MRPVEALFFLDRDGCPSARLAGEKDGLRWVAHVTRDTWVELFARVAQVVRRTELQEETS